MSIWTHVRGIIYVDSYARTSAESQYITQTVLNHLPRVKGSEGPMDVMVYPLPGHSFSSNVDEFQNHSNLWNHRWSMFAEQTRSVIVLCGDLRDVEFSDGLHQFARWLTRLSKRLSVYDIMVKVESGSDKHLFTDASRWRDLYEVSNNWTQYMRWEFDDD